MFSEHEIELRYRRYKSLNSTRLDIAFNILNVESKNFLKILPVLLHYNDVNIPGYRRDYTPCGIGNFTLDTYQKNYVKSLCKGRDIEEPCCFCIHGLYAMGSTSSLGQGSSSDLDVWVCVHSDMKESDIAILNDKCKFISTLAHAKGVDLNLFVTKEDRFTSNTSDLLDGDNCGSAQNLLLLDEFYRTSIKLAGKDLIWFLISNEEEKEDYYKYVDLIFKFKNFSKDKFFDFGPVVNISPQEYFGSALWTLYKGIDSPFKATIKILLMESYSHDYPHTVLLCSQLKESMQKMDGYSFAEDAYYIMFTRVSDYLINKKDFRRYDLVTMCFYIKIYTGLRNLPNTTLLSRKINMLNEFKRKWKWTDKRIEQVENTDNWKVNYVNELYRKIIASLIESYKELLRFTVRYNIEYAITSDDASILSRKLFVAFDKYQGKIILLPNELTKSLEEDNISFIKAHKNSLCKKGWHVYTKATYDVGILSDKVVYTSNRIVDSITWACFNNIMSDQSNVFVGGDFGIVNKQKIKSLSYDLNKTLLAIKRQTADAELRRPREVKKALIVLNFENDPTANTHLTLTDLEEGSSLSCGRQKQCLIGSIDLVLINNWGELRTISIPDSEDGVLDLFATLTKLSRNDEFVSLESILNSISVSCYAKNHKDLIRYDLEQTIKKLFSVSLNKDVDEYSFIVGKNTYIATNNDTEMRGFNIKKMGVFGTDDYDISILSRYGMRPEFFLQVPPIVESYSTIGVIQFFFVPKENVWCIYIVNEKNEVEIYDNFVGSRTTLVNAINRFYIKVSQECSSLNLSRFNLPQYFVLNKEQTEIHPFTISAKE